MARRIAFLVLAHHQPRHLARLVGALADETTRIFVHVDGAVDPAPFRRALADRAGVHLVEPRLAVRWGGQSLVRATLTLLEAAVAAGPFVRYCLLSGADFPIKPGPVLRRALLDDERELMRVGVRLDSGADPVRRDTVERYHLTDVAFLNPRHRPSGGLARRLRRSARLLANGVTAALPRRRFPCGLVPYKGSQWWCLSEACVSHLRAFVQQHPEYLRFHRWVHCPDEVFFHSLVKASPFAARISHDLDPPGLLRGAHFIDWPAGAGTPKVLEAGDFERLAVSPALFARKFDETRSAALLDRVEAELLQASPARRESAAAPGGGP